MVTMPFGNDLDFREVSRRMSNYGYAFYFIGQQGYPGEDEEPGYNENPTGSKPRKMSKANKYCSEYTSKKQ